MALWMRVAIQRVAVRDMVGRGGRRIWDRMNFCTRGGRTVGERAGQRHMLSFSVGGRRGSAADPSSLLRSNVNESLQTDERGALLENSGRGDRRRRKGGVRLGRERVSGMDCVGGGIGVGEGEGGGGQGAVLGGLGRGEGVGGDVGRGAGEGEGLGGSVGGERGLGLAGVPGGGRGG